MRKLSWFAACAVPLFYLVVYTPYGMDTTDFGYFYAYAWRILEGQLPYRDFHYIKPALPLYWHALWMWLTPFEWQILAGKAGFCITLLAASWLGALYLKKAFSFPGFNLPLLATCGFVFGVHSFPHMPWHTADGVFFCAASLYAAICGHAFLAGILSACAMACKQSFALVPVAIFLLLWFLFPRKKALAFTAGLALTLACFCLWLICQGAWADFRAMTTGQLDIREALDAGILIYLRQNWLIPCAAVLPFLVCLILKKRLPAALEPAWCYLFILTVWYVFTVFQQKTWIGFGASWPTLFMLLAGAQILFPGYFLAPLFRKGQSRLAASLCLLAPALASWSVAISGGYKIPAMFAVPLIFAFLSFHARFYGSGKWLAWGTLAAGLSMFGAGYQYPYVFPVRPLARSEMQYDAGQVYPQATGVYVDRDMYERLEELKSLTAKYRPHYKTLPGFSFAYYLNGDYPQIASDWLIDWEINGDTDRLYDELLNKDITVLMERDQLHAEKADAYERAGYTVPQRIVKSWRIVEETPHFVVFRRPEGSVAPGR